MIQQLCENQYRKTTGNHAVVSEKARADPRPISGAIEIIAVDVPVILHALF